LIIYGVNKRMKMHQSNGDLQIVILRQKTFKNRNQQDRMFGALPNWNKRVKLKKVGATMQKIRKVRKSQKEEASMLVERAKKVFKIESN
jgi:hypothetical protein